MMFLIWLLLLLGIVYLITEAAILSQLRVALYRWHRIFVFIYCPACVGFWVGAVLALFNIVPDASFSWDPSWSNWAWPSWTDIGNRLACGVMAMAVCHLRAAFAPNYAWQAEQAAANDEE